VAASFIHACEETERSAFVHLFKDAQRTGILFRTEIDNGAVL